MISDEELRELLDLLRFYKLQKTIESVNHDVKIRVDELELEQLINFS